MKNLMVLALVALIACLATTQAAAPSKGSTRVRATFSNLTTDGIRSDGLTAACGVDYADVGDSSCSDQNYSFLLNNNDYFLRTVVNHSVTPSRSLRLHFGAPVTPGDCASCPNLDESITSYVDSCSGAALPGTRNTSATSPLAAEPCDDLVEVRFFVYGAFKPSATTASIRVDRKSVV